MRNSIVAIVAITVGALGAGACGAEDGPAAGDPSSASRSAASIIGDWENACGVHDPGAVKEFMGILEFSAEPGLVQPGGGYSRNTAGCDAEFTMKPYERKTVDGGTETDDSLRGSLYLRVDYQYSETTMKSSFEEAYQKAYRVWEEEQDDAGVVSERDITGGWDEGALFIAEQEGNWAGQNVVIARMRDGAYAITFEVRYSRDPVKWWQYQDRQVYSYTAEELADWVAGTYLPQVHEAVEAELGTNR